MLNIYNWLQLVNYYFKYFYLACVRPWELLWPSCVQLVFSSCLAELKNPLPSPDWIPDRSDARAKTQNKPHFYCTPDSLPSGFCVCVVVLLMCVLLAW